MILPRISIQRPVLASMMSLGLILFGIIGLSRLPVRELPDIDPPIVSVTTVYPGANAQVVETEVSERLEEVINNIEGIKTLTSQSREQVSNIAIEFELSRNIDLAAQDVRDRVSRVRGQLPESVKEPIIAKADSDAQPIIWVGLNSDRYSTLELTTVAERQIKNRLQTIPGVSSVVIGGEKRFAIRLWLDSEKMAARRVSILDVERALRQQNVELPSGRVENLQREMTIETRGELKTPDEFNQLSIRNEGATIIRLRDIGEAKEGVEDERTIARFNGKPAVFLGIVKQSKANTVEVARGIRRELEAIKRILPAGVEARMAFDSSIYVERAISEVWSTLGLAFVLVVLIIFVFLRSFRSTIIPAVAIPVSIVGAFGLLYFFGYSINILTMLAFVLAIGVVVDDAIVVLENIHRHIELGEPPMKAAFKAMDEIGFAIIAITISLVAVFLPLAFQRSSTGQLFTEFAVAVAGSVVISAFVALSLSPMMASRILKPIGKHGPVFNAFERGFDWFNHLYKRTLGWSLRHRLAVLMVGLAALATTVLTYRLLDQEFLTNEDKGWMFCFVIAPEGATSEYTDRMIKKMEGFVAETPEVQAYAGIVALAMAGPGQANQGIMFVNLKQGKRRHVQDIVNGPGGLSAKFWNNVEGAIAIANIPKALDRNFNAPFQLIVQGQDLQTLNEYSAAAANKLQQAGFLQNVRSSFEVNKPQLRLNINRNRAAALGVSIEDISRTLQILFGGLDLSRIKLAGKEYEVIAQLQREARLTPQDLDRLYVRNTAGELIQLSSLVTHQSGPAPNVIEHYGRLRSATISGTPVGVPIGTAVKKTEELLAGDIPPGFSLRWEGEARDLQTAAREVWWVFVLAIIIVYMVLAAQFESLLHPFTVMLAVPLAGLGAFGLLWLLDFGAKQGLYKTIPGMNINLFSQIGLILLVGLVTKNSILLVEFANQQRQKGLAAHDAMMEAGAVRLRPILMTAFSTIAGILPIAIGFGAGAESRRPMGVAVVGGMLTSTFLTLIIIPVVYTILSDLADFLLRRNKKAAPAGAVAAGAATPASPH
jgi:multidrug efflux pump